MHARRSWLSSARFSSARSWGFRAHTLELNAAYLDNWLRVLRSDKRAIFKHAADAQRACDFLVAASEVGQAEQAA